MTPLRTAVIGLGWWGKHITTSLAESPFFRVTDAADPAAEALGDFARQHRLVVRSSLDEILADQAIDAVVIATPHSLHEEQVVAAIAAGKQGVLRETAGSRGNRR